MPRFRVFLRLLAILATLSAPLVAQDGPPDADAAAWADWEKRAEQWFEPVEAGQTARVVNRYGNIYARFGGYEKRMELLATVQTLDPERPDLEVRRTPTDGGGLDVSVEDPAPNSKGKRGRIDLVVFVPEGVALQAETEGDLIEIKGLHSDVSARTGTGDIRIRGVDGRVNVSTDRGEISVALESAATRQPQELVSKTGNIELHVWEDADFDVDLRTSGQITTDFSLQIEHRRFEEPGKIATTVIGEGGPRLAVSSKRGQIKLLRLIRDAKPRE